MLPEFKVALWDFEFALIKRTILRHKGVRGLVFLVSISTSTGKYIRSLDLESMVGVSLEHGKSITTDSNHALCGLIMDQILTDRDVVTLMSSSSEMAKPSSTDRHTIRDKFKSLCKLDPALILALAIEFGDKDELVLCSGIDSQMFRTTINRARAVSSVSHLGLIVWNSK